MNVTSDRLRVGWLNAFSSGRGAAKAGDAQGTPTPSHIAPNIPVNKDNVHLWSKFRGQTIFVSTKNRMNCRFSRGVSSRTLEQDALQSRRHSEVKGFGTPRRLDKPGPSRSPISHEK